MAWSCCPAVGCTPHGLVLLRSGGLHQTHHVVRAWPNGGRRQGAGHWLLMSLGLHGAVRRVKAAGHTMVGLWTAGGQAPHWRCLPRHCPDAAACPCTPALASLPACLPSHRCDTAAQRRRHRPQTVTAARAGPLPRQLGICPRYSMRRYPGHWETRRWLPAASIHCVEPQLQPPLLLLGLGLCCGVLVHHWQQRRGWQRHICVADRQAGMQGRRNIRTFVGWRLGAACPWQRRYAKPTRTVIRECLPRPLLIDDIQKLRVPQQVPGQGGCHRPLCSEVRVCWSGPARHADGRRRRGRRGACRSQQRDAHPLGPRHASSAQAPARLLGSPSRDSLR